jgi:hypothetical protein
MLHCGQIGSGQTSVRDYERSERLQAGLLTARALDIRNMFPRAQRLTSIATGRYTKFDGASQLKNVRRNGEIRIG